MAMVDAPAAAPAPAPEASDFLRTTDGRNAPRTVVFGPCNHFLACASCADALQECPNCRATINTRTTIANSS